MVSKWPQGVPEKKEWVLSGIVRKTGGGPFSPTAFLVNENSLFLLRDAVIYVLAEFVR